MGATAGGGHFSLVSRGVGGVSRFGFKSPAIHDVGPERESPPVLPLLAPLLRRKEATQIKAIGPCFSSVPGKIYPGGEEMEVLPLVLLLRLVWNSCALPLRTRSPLTIHPKEPLVEVGGSIQLHCSLDCPGGKVQWEGLDTDLGNVMSNHNSSILTVTNATVRMEGMKICTGQCQGKSFQKTVELQVYSLPNTLQLDSEPEVPTAGQPAHLFCLASQVYPPDAFMLSWFQGDEKLERHVEEEMEDSNLFTFHSKLEIPMAAEQTTYRCEAQLQIGQRLFHRSRTVTIQAEETQEIATTTETASSQTAAMATFGGTPERTVPATDGDSSREATTGSLSPLHSTERPSISTPVGATTAAPGPGSWTSPTVGRHPSTGSPSTARIPLGEASAVSSKPTGLSSTAGVHSMRTHIPIRETSAELGVTSKALPTTDQQPAMGLASATSSLPAKRTAVAKKPNPTVARTPALEGLCRPVITSFPPQGTVGKPLRITCHTVECHKDTRVQWVETPLAQSRYHQEKAEGRSTLAVDSVSSEHQGVYRCIAMTSQPQMASIRVELRSTAAISTNALITIGSAGSLLGLFLASYVSRRIWQRHSK